MEKQLTAQEKKKLYYQKNRDSILRMAKARYRKIKEDPYLNERLKAYDRNRQRKSYNKKD